MFLRKPGKCSVWALAPMPLLLGEGGHTLSLVYLHHVFLYILFSNLQEIVLSLTRASSRSNTWPMELLTSWSTSMVWLLSDRICVSDGHISAHAMLSCECSLCISSVASTSCALWWTHGIRSQIGSCKHNYFMWLFSSLYSCGTFLDFSALLVSAFFQLCLYLLAVVGKMLLICLSNKFHY